ncbi:cytochrome P450 [Streptomyces sp. URMC 123]|uniref:cytochrome P450 n=1 Tax=Streptomyces sp. URMC 123 TaxID=3423403 RepID=UPI003F197FD1
MHQQIKAAPGRLPLVGHGHRLVRDPLGFLTSRRGGDAVSEIRIGGRSCLLVSSARAARQVLASPRFDKGGPFMETARGLVGNGVITCADADHRRQQPVMRPAFRRDRVAAYAEVMCRCVDEAVDDWRDGDTVDVGRRMYALAARVVARTLISSPAGRRAADTMAEALPVLLDGMFRRMLVPWPPAHRVPLPANRRFARARLRLETAIGEVIGQYRASGAAFDDLLSQVMAAAADDGRPLGDREVRDQVMSVLAAGVETTASLLAWTYYALADHARVEDRLWEELDTTVESGSPSFEDLPRLPYTRQVLTEVLRLWPPTWMLSRVVVADTVVEGFVLPAGADVIVSPYALQRDPEVFPEPEVFDPDRWLPERVTAEQRQAFTAFGGGRRKCLGEAYGMTEAALALATISSRWRLRAVAGGPVRAVPRFLLTPRGGPLVLERRAPGGRPTAGSGR